MQMCIDSEALSSLLAHAASAARFIGQLDVDDSRIAALGDHVDAVVHGLTELLGEPRGVTCSGRAPHDGSPALAANAGGSS